MGAFSQILETSQRLFIGLMQPVQNPIAGCKAAGKTGAEQITASRCFPIQHLARAEDSLHILQHQFFIQRIKSDAAGSADSFAQWACAV